MYVVILVIWPLKLSKIAKAGFEVVNCRIVIIQVIAGSYSVDVGEQNVIEVILHHLLCRPMVGRMCDVPIFGEIVFWMASVCLSLIDKLYG